MHASLWLMSTVTKTKFKKSNQSKQKARWNCDLIRILFIEKSSSPEVFLGKGVLKICSKFTGEHPCRSVASINLQSNFIEITFLNGFSPVNLLHISRTPFPKNTSVGLLPCESVTITSNNFWKIFNNTFNMSRKWFKSCPFSLDKRNWF